MSQQQGLQTAIESARRAFGEKFSREPRFMTAAPGRVNLIGEHTDYNDGFVLPMAIDRYTVLAADRPAEGQPSRVFSTGMDAWAPIAVSGPIRPGEVTWSSYVQGTVAGCLAAGLEPGPFEGVIHSNVPLGGGLSSSAALEVSTATLMEVLSGKTLGAVEKALLCQKAEHDYAGMPCGIMDQFISVLAEEDQLMLLDCRSRVAEMVPMSDRSVSVLVINTNVKHELTGSEYPERRAQCEHAAGVLDVLALRDSTLSQLAAAREKLDDVHFRRARHVIGEIARTTDAASAIRRADWPEVGRLMYASHESLKDDYEVSCPELDALVDAARTLDGVIGSRMTGGGFGGCTVTLVRTDRIDAVCEAIDRAYREKTGIEPTMFATRPAGGACVVS